MPALSFSSEAEIHRIGLGLIDRSLPKGEWTHAAHFAAALWLMRYRADRDPALAMPNLIRAYNEATGVSNTATSGYHETITLASLKAARAVFQRYHAYVPVCEIANALLATELGRSDWLLAYWNRETLFSPLARRVWVEPDRATFPW